MKLINVKPKSTRCSVGHSLQKALKPRKKLGAHGKKKTLKQLYIAHVKKKAAEFFRGNQVSQAISEAMMKI